MQTVVSNFRIHQDPATAEGSCGLLSGDESSSPKSPKLNELLAKHHAFQRQELDFISPINEEDGDTTINVLML